MSAFLQPWMLWGLGLASVPIVIHLLNRRRYQTVRWAAMAFLRAAFRKNQRRLRFENLLLLLVRTALIALLALALARPFVSGGVASALGSGSVHYTVVLDNSYSMGLNEGVTRPFDRAVDEARRIAGTLRAEDSLTLYLTNDNYAGARPGVPRAVLRDSHEPEKVRSVLGTVTVSAGRSEMVEVLAVVADEMESRVPGKQLILLTDLQRRAWETTASDAGGGEPSRAADGDLSGAERTIRDLFGDIEGKGANIHLVDVGSTLAENVAIVDLAPVEDRPLVEGNSEPFRTRLANYGRRPVTVDVTFSVDDSHKGAVSVEVPGALPAGPPGEAEARFSFPDLAPGPRTFSAELPVDALTADNRRLYVGDVRERIRILAVDGDPTSETTPETFFLKPAIALMSDRIDMEDVDPLAFTSRELADFDVLILANVDRFRDEQVAAMEKFVEGGGGLVVFLGDKVDPDLLDRTLGKEGDGLLPGALADRPVLLDRAAGGVPISLEAPPHPLFRDILGPEADPEGLWEEPHAWGYYPVTPYEDDSVLLRYRDAESNPALLERSRGKGRVLLFTTSADMDWGDLPATFVVPILWHQMIFYLTAEDPGDRNLRPFATYARELPERVLEVQVTGPHGSRTTVAPILTEGEPPRLEYRDTGRPGRYQVSTSVRGTSAIDAGTERATELFAVNVDGREGDLRRIAPEELDRRYPLTRLDTVRTWSPAGTRTSAEPKGEIWRGLAAAVLALLFLEIWMARRFGAPTRRMARPTEVTP